MVQLAKAIKMGPAIYIIVAFIVYLSVPYTEAAETVPVPTEYPISNRQRAIQRMQTMPMMVSMQELAENRQGTVNTLDLNLTSEHVKVIWYFRFSEEVILTLDMHKLIFPQNVSGGCCSTNALYLPKNYQELNKFCSNTTTKKTVSVGKYFSITLMSQYDVQGMKFDFSVRPKTELCSESRIKCLDGQRCYDMHKICDGEFDCEDHSDEQNCGKCKTNYTLCNNQNRATFENRKCFHPVLHRCDGILHCPSGEDEFDCAKTCNNNFQCSGRIGCYTHNQRCDGSCDCIDCSDEANCHTLNCDALSDRSNYYVCKNGWCISKGQVNNGIIDCDDGSDEPNPFTILTWSLGCLCMIVLGAIIWVATKRIPELHKGGTKIKPAPQLKKKQQFKRNPSFIYNYEVQIHKKDPNSLNSSLATAPDCSEPIYDVIDPAYISSNSTVTTISGIYEEIDVQAIEDDACSQLNNASGPLKRYQTFEYLV